MISLFLSAGCEEPFHAIEPSDRYFSIYGHLDAAADTQWVRVVAVRASIHTSPEPIDAIVTLEEVETGRVTVMADSLVSFRAVNLDGDDLYAHNFSTTERIQPGYTYRLTATRSDGASSSAAASIPVIDPTVVMTHYSSPLATYPAPAEARVYGLRHLAMALEVRTIPPECGHPARLYAEYLPTRREAASDEDYHLIGLEWAHDARPSFLGSPPPCPVPLGPKRIALVASGSPWPFHSMLNYREITHPGAVGNVQNGVGLLAGVVTEIYPFEPCVPVTGTSCQVTYSARSASLEGRVVNSCLGGLVEEALVSVLESGGNALREVTTGADGRYLIEGLNPGIAHTLSATHDVFVDFEDTLVLEEGQRTIFDIPLQHVHC